MGGRKESIIKLSEEKKSKIKLSEEENIWNLTLGGSLLALYWKISPNLQASLRGLAINDTI